LEVARRSDHDACDHFDEPAEAFREADDRWGLAVAMAARGNYALLAGDLAGAQRRHTEALAVAVAIDNEYVQAGVLDVLGLDAAVGRRPDHGGHRGARSECVRRGL
jgi:hypothetical protein